MAYSVKILADSYYNGSRLTTMEVTFPRIVLAEFNTHRVFSRNSASSRAIPIKKQIERVRTDPFVPSEFGSAQPGMVPAEALTGRRHKRALRAWKLASRAACYAAGILDKLEVHKSYANRLLEPFLWHTVIVTSTEWSNFFALRNHQDAQEEIRTIAEMMEDAYQGSVPRELRIGQLHIPLVHADELEFHTDSQLLNVSAGRCARVSFDTQWRSEPGMKSIERADGLRRAGHMSPFEHQAVAGGAPNASGNFTGSWVQHRKMYVHEDDFSYYARA